ncbi:hypothetical protein HPULCUR_009541 [Helicostylum pulchrum]|uniref:G protein alpha subunit n=1 Tax=Helicostylum pulchrum TaxID=562976 RepID=A0ABP9YBB0_9FUNG
MGNCINSGSKLEGQNPDMHTNKAIERQIKADEKKLRSEVKLLLLGNGESGKSTVIKQMRLIHASGFDASERESFRVIVFSNITVAMQILLEIIEQLNIPLQHENYNEYIPLFQNVEPIKRNEPYPSKYLEPLKLLWNDSGIQAAKQKGNMFAFFEQLDKFWEPGYMPSDQDIIRCRAKTTGIVETIFHIGPLTYRMFDVGGQRSERKKWIHCFENVTAVLFVVAISGYDQCLIEDRDSNQASSATFNMHEGLMLFDTICNSPWFVNTSMILFLNKIDIFKEKILTSPVSKYFPDFKGNNSNFEETSDYFRKRFRRLNHNPSKSVYTHNTDATDTKLLEHVMVSVSDIILNENINTLML